MLTTRPHHSIETSYNDASYAVQNAASLANGATMATRLNGDMLQHTRALEATMASNSDPKFKNSKFLQFLSKMSNGEVILEDNQVCPSALPVSVDSLTSTHSTFYCHSVWYLPCCQPSYQLQVVQLPQAIIGAPSAAPDHMSWGGSWAQQDVLSARVNL